MKIAVVGSGVVGLTTALELQKEFRNAKIFIIADKFYKETTSYVAAGIFRPGTGIKQREAAENYDKSVLGTSFSGPTDEITKKWVYDAYHHWDDIRKSADSSLAGVCQLSGYIFSSTSQSITRVKSLLGLISCYGN